jgi:Starch-binding associating with outer membrane
MKYTNKQILFAIMSIGIAFASCKKSFLDVNKDPNRVTDDNITAELIFTQAAVSVGDRAVGGSASASGAKLPTQFLQNWIGYMASNGDFARDNTETTYNIDFGFGNPLFGNTYNTLFDLHQAEVKGLIGKDTAVAGASIILSAKLFQEMVDLFGDLPYSQAFQVDKYPRPAYDKAQDIYAALQKRLDTAIIYMNLKTSKSFTSADVINSGSKDKWIKFANTLKLRLLIRQSQVPSFNPSAEITKILNKGGILGAGESISVNPGYVNDVDKQSPFYANYGYGPTGVIATTSTNANAYIIDILDNNNDLRIERFFTPVGSNFVGDTYGDEPGNLPAGNQSSYFGPALVNSATQNQWIFPSYESLFLRAEAVARGWIPGNDSAAYAAAVTESFVWLGVPDAVNEAADYMNSNAIANYATVATATTLVKAKFIAFQKYIANTGIDPFESYADQRRLDFLPAGYISVNPGKVSNKLPLRLLYPQSEYTTNAENVLKEGTINPFTTKLFWEP